MDVFVARKGFRGRNLPVKISQNLQGDDIDGLKSIKRNLYEHTKNFTKSDNMPRWYRYELPSSTFCDPRNIRIGQVPKRSDRIPVLTSIQQPNSDNDGKNMLYSQNININHGVYGVPHGRIPSYHCFGTEERRYAWDTFGGVERRCQRLDDRHKENQERSDFLRGDHHCHQDQANRPCYHFDQYSDSNMCECDLPSSDLNFIQAYQHLRGTTLNAVQRIEALYFNFVDIVSNQRHLNVNTRTAVWKNMINRNDDAERVHSRRRYIPRASSNIDSNNDVHDGRRYSWRSDMSLRDVRRELHTCFNDFEQCIPSIMTGEPDLHPRRMDESRYEDERTLQRRRDSQRLHSRIVRDINDLRPLLDRMSHDYNETRLILCDLQVILERLDGFWKFWGDDMQHDKRRQHSRQGRPAGGHDNEGQRMPSIWSH